MRYIMHGLNMALAGTCVKSDIDLVRCVVEEGMVDL